MMNASTSVEVYFTPVELMGRVGFSPELAEKRAKYSLVYRCHAACGTELQGLLHRLSTGRRLSGERLGAPGPGGLRTGNGAPALLASAIVAAMGLQLAPWRAIARA